MEETVFVVLNSMETSVESGHSPMPESPDIKRQKSQPDMPLSQWEPLVNACVAQTSEIAEVIQAFWGVSLRLEFLGLGSQAHYFWRLDDFHVTQMALTQPNEDEAATALLRLSDTLCSSLLQVVLGECQTPFSFKRLSPLEATVLNEFSRDLLVGFKKQLIRKSWSAETGTQPLHLIWVLRLGDETSSLEVGKLVLTVPADAIRPAKHLATEPGNPAPVPDAFFYHVPGKASIYLGSTRVPLADLEHLEPDDVIILETSQSDQMFVVDPHSGERLPFPARIRQQQQMTIPYTQEMAMMETEHSQSLSAKQALWDNLMIEVGAQFEPVKLPLKQLKQMTEGLVIEMGDLVDNRICLQVEGKTLAWGELLIVGDKFGVRISKVQGNQHPDEPLDAPSGAASQGHGGMAALASAASAQQTPPQGAGSEEEVNLDNFLNDDFDDTFDDEEEW